MWSLALLITAQALQLDAHFSVDFAIRRYTALLSLTCRAPGWCGLALGAGMHNTDQIVVFLQANGTAKVEDAFSFGYNTPALDVDIGGSNDVRIVGIERTEDGRFNVTVERSLRTSDSFDTDIRAEVVTYSYAYSHDTGFEYHYENAGRFTIDLSSAVVKKPKPIAEDWKVHSSLLFNLWVFVVPVIIAISRFLRFWRYSTVVHSLGGLAVLACTVHQVLDAYSRAQKGAAGFHARVGMLLGSLALAQAASGAASLWFSHRKLSHAPAKLSRTAHFAIAVCMILAALRNIWYARRPPYGSSLVARAAIIVIPVVLVCGELVCRWRAVTKLCLSHKSTDSIVNISAQGGMLALFNQYIIDVGALGIYHPGGVEPIVQNLYDNMGKYLYAVVRPEGSVSVPHSSFAIETAKRMAIAVQDFPDSLFHRVNRTQGYKAQSWRLQRKVEVADSTWSLSLTSADVKCAKAVSVDLMGKYVMVKRNGVRRYYSVAQCLRIDNLREWVSFARTHNVQIASPEDSLITTSETEEIDGAVSLVVRAYSPASVSHWLCSLHPGESVRFKGPFGRGLVVAPSFRGQALAVVGGTGLVPLLDLVQFLWWKEAKAQGLPVACDTSALDGLRLTLCVAFHSEDNAFGLFLLRSLQRLCEGQENPRFRLQLWFALQDDRESRVERIRKEIRTLGLAKVWVCGPAGLEASVREIAARESISPALLTFL